MAHLPAVRRKLYMHPAHPTIGVSGLATARAAYRQFDDFSTEDMEPPPPEPDGDGPESERGLGDGAPDP